jgi:hypothetical protein
MTDGKKDFLHPTIFHEPWWLDLATQGAVRTVQVREGGIVVGELPFVTRQRVGFSCVVMPDLTHFLGPAVVPGQGNEGTRFLRQHEIVKALIDQLPRSCFFEAKCHRGVTDVLAFQERRFKTSVQFTKEIEPQDSKAVWKAMRDKQRGAIRRGLDSLTLEPWDDVAAFLRFYEENLDERCLVNNMNRAIFASVLQGSLARGRGRILSARDRSGALVAATFVVWDSTAAYFLLASRKRLADNGAVSCLVWHEIKAAMECGLIFDFDGILNEGMTRFFSGFAGALQPRYIVRRLSLPFQIAWDVKQALTGERFFV